MELPHHGRLGTRGEVGDGVHLGSDLVGESPEVPAFPHLHRDESDSVLRLGS